MIRYATAEEQSVRTALVEPPRLDTDAHCAQSRHCLRARCPTHRDRTLCERWVLEIYHSVVRREVGIVGDAPPAAGSDRVEKALNGAGIVDDQDSAVGVIV